MRRVRTRRVCRFDNVIKTTPLFQAVTFETPVLVLIVMRGLGVLVREVTFGYLCHHVILIHRHMSENIAINLLYINRFLL